MSGKEDGRKRRSRINSKINQLPDDVRATVDAMLADVTITYADVAEYLVEQGYEISRSSVGRYALQVNRAAQRVAENLDKMRAVVKVVEDNPDLDYTKANRILLMDGIMNRLSTAEEEFAEMPLDKAGRLIASLSRVQIAEDRMRQEFKSKVELAFEGMEAEIMTVIKSDKALAVRLRAVLAEAKEKMMRDD